MESERWNGRMNPTFAPLLFSLIEQLATYSTNASSAIDPVTTSASRKIYQDICDSEEGKKVLKNNLAASFGLSSLQIATFPSVDGTQFANTGHVDKNDLNGKAFHKAMANRVMDELLNWSYEEHEQSRIEDKRKQYFQGLLHLLRMGMIDQEQSDDWSDLKYETETTCVYNPIYVGPNEREVFCGFLYPKNKTLVRFRLNQRTIQRWRSNTLFHQTPVSYTYDKKKVYFKDVDLIVLAWGAGTSNKRRDFIADQQINFNGTIRGTTHLCEILRNNEAPREAFVAARAAFTYHQRCITDFFSRNYPDDEPLT
jgi:hypothetical protein